jgi:hypothetical protein
LLLRHVGKLMCQHRTLLVGRQRRKPWRKVNLIFKLWPPGRPPG